MSSATDVGTEIVRSVDQTGSDVPHVLLYTPVVPGNPFQELLYGALWDHGVAAIECQNFRALRTAEVAISAGGSAVVHVHWTSNITAAAKSPVEYLSLAGEFLGIIDDLKSIGVKVLWTVHNPIEHDAAFPDAEIEFRERFAQAADAIHLMSAEALNVIAPLYKVDAAKVFVVPHPAYVGVYPDYATSPASRHRLGLGRDDLVVGVLGALRGYKRIDVLHAACQRASLDGRRVRLLCAGATPNGEAMANTLAMLRRDPWTTLIPRQLSDREMSEVAAACDVIACVYDSPLTSGVSMLAMSLRRPALLPDRPISRHLAGEAAVYVDGGSIEALTRCLQQLDRNDLKHRGLIARGRVEEFRHDLIAGQFADHVERLL